MLQTSKACFSYLLVILRSISDLLLQHDAPLGLLRVEWISGNYTRNLRATANQLLQVAGQLAVRHLLIDMNTVPDISVYDQLWMGANFMPGLVQLPLERLVLVISSQSVHNQMAIDALHDLVQPSIRFDSQYFSRPQEAMCWITDESDRVPELLAEWAAARPNLPYSRSGLT